MLQLRTTLTLTATVLAALALAACSSPSGSMSGMDHGSSPVMSSPAMAAGTFNDADTTFATGMVPHHMQAVTMADMILKKDDIDPAVIDLAKKIKAAQGPEITTMNSWLTAWGNPIGMPTSMPGMDMDTGMGMMSDADMAALDAATGVTASKLFLTEMIQHHQGAIDMANIEVASGKNRDALLLAKNIIASQTAEIQTMKDLLGTLQ